MDLLWSHAQPPPNQDTLSSLHLVPFPTSAYLRWAPVSSLCMLFKIFRPILLWRVVVAFCVDILHGHMSASGRNVHAPIRLLAEWACVAPASGRSSSELAVP
eukprot:356849-Chlamydomonas_euryale.AAC.1